MTGQGGLGEGPEHCTEEGLVGVAFIRGYTLTQGLILVETGHKEFPLASFHTTVCVWGKAQKYPVPFLFLKGK